MWRSILCKETTPEVGTGREIWNVDRVDESCPTSGIHC